MGWGHPNELLPFLLRAHPQYLRSFHAAQAAARQWELVEPENPADPANPGAAPTEFAWMKEGIAENYAGYAFSNSSGLPNELFAEQMLAYDLGEKVERKEEPKRISLTRFEELFRKVLHKESIDESWSAVRQVREFFNSTADYIAVTQNGKYSTLVSRLTVLNTIIKKLTEQKQKA